MFYRATSKSALQERLESDRASVPVEFESGADTVVSEALTPRELEDAVRRLSAKSTFEVELLDAWMQP
jgi:hypothetical protein